MSEQNNISIPALDFKKTPLIVAIAQDHQTNEILMQAFISEESWEATLKSGYATYFSRSRQKLWRKGESSGNLQLIKDIWVDCDLDSVIFRVEQIGGKACHTGKRSCFFRRIENGEIKER